MATAASLQGLCEESTCSICLEYLKDPVITECGHNFCRSCLGKYWGGLGANEISCPQCREKVQSKIISNLQLGNFVELTKKICLQEEKSPEGKDGACGKHQKPLQLFCKDDKVFLCVACDKKEHQDHQVVPLGKAAQDYQHFICRHLEFLEEERTKILTYKTEIEEKSQELLNQTKAEIENTKKQFREIQSFLNKHEKLLLDHLEKVEKETARKRDTLLDRLSAELSSLGSLIQEITPKCQQPPGELLQDIRSILQSCEKKEPFQDLLAFRSEQSLEISEVRDRNTFLAGLMKQLKEPGRPILATLAGLTCLRDGPLSAMTPGLPRAGSSEWDGHSLYGRYGPSESLLSQPFQQKANVTLDPDTAHPRLVLSEDGKSVTCGEKDQDLTNSPERFDQCFYVLGYVGFTRGRRYWEVTVGKEGHWAVGMARKSIRRKGDVALSAKEGIWAIGKWDSEKEPQVRVAKVSSSFVPPQDENLRKGPPLEAFTFPHTPVWERPERSLFNFSLGCVPPPGENLKKGPRYRTSNLSDPFGPPLGENLRRIRVSLNCEEGKVSFYDGDTGSHLYTFSEGSFFRETLLLFFYMDGRASLTISP